MILRSITVRNWRCLVEPVKVGPFSERVNVLHAPNSTGKSTLFEALHRGLLDGHRVSGREVEAIRPWGRSLSPKVMIEFASEGTEYRVTKGFLEAAEAVLERKENGRFRRVAEGDAADGQIRAILGSSPPGRGLARPENWGLAQVLWAGQGNLAITSLSGDLLTDIHASLGAQVSGPRAAPIEERIEAAYLQFFTPGGKLKTGKDAPELVRLRKRLDAAHQKHAAALEQQRGFEEAARRVEDLEARRRQTTRDAEEISKTFKAAQAEVERYRTLSSEKKERSEQLKAAEAQYNGLSERIETIKIARKELAGAQEDVRRLERDLPPRTREIENRDKEAAEAKAALENVRKGRLGVDRAEGLAEDARSFLEGRKRLSDIDDRLKRIAAAQRELTLNKKKRAELLAPDSKALKAIRKALKERDEAQIRIDAALITLEIVPEKRGALMIISGEKTGEVALRAGKSAQVKGAPEVVIDWLGAGRLRASGPTGEIDQLRQVHHKANRRLKQLLEPLSTTELEELEALSERAKELERKAAEMETQVNTLLSGLSVEEIQQERALIGGTLEKILEQRPDWEESPPDGEVLRRQGAETKRSFISAVEAAEARRDKAQEGLTVTVKQRTELETQLKDAKKQVKRLEPRLADLTQDGKADEQRQKELKKLSLAWNAARASVEEIEDKLSVFTEDPVGIASKLEMQLQAIEKRATELLKEEERERGRVDELSAQGPYSSLANVEEEMAELQRQIDDQELRIEAIRLVHDVAKQSRSEVLASVAGPVEASSTRMLQRIAGGRLGRLQLGESFEPLRVLPEISDSSVPLEYVSGGEHEQIHLATRLALADVLSKDERQLVVLDDVLPYTDTGRFARVIRILEEAAQRLQLLILTCHPERYRGMEQAHFLDLEAILRASSE